MQKSNLIVSSFEEAFSFDSLLTAHKKCRCNKNHKREVISFEVNLFQNLLKLSNSILNGTYNIESYRNFFVYEPKKRNIESLSYRHRLVQYVLCKQILEPVLERRLIYTNCACRCSKGTGFARDMFELYLHKLAKKKKSKAYFLKCDVSKYFASIDHEILLEKLHKINFEPKAYNLIKLIIDSHNQDTGKGVPIGNQTSQWFALLYLDSIDRFIKEKLRCKYYVRYMDDLILLSDDVDYLKNCRKQIIEFGKSLKLNFNKKTQVRSFKEGVSYIGFLYKVLENGRVVKTLKSQTKKRLKHNVKQMSFFYNQKMVDKEYLAVRVVSYHNFYNGYNNIKYVDKLFEKYSKKD